MAVHRTIPPALALLLPFSGQAACLLTGSGAAAAPYLVGTFAELERVGKGDCPLSGDYRLVADIDASGSAGQDSGRGFKPIGDGSGNTFSGSFHGGGHSISHLRIVRPGESEVGLFGSTGWIGNPGTPGWNVSSTVIDSLDLLDLDVLGGGPTGGLTSTLYYGKVRNCTVTGRVASTSVVSGYCGGLVGDNWVGTILDSRSSAKVEGVGYVGGVVGISQQGLVQGSYATGEVRGTGSSIGGLAGDNSGTIQECFSTGAVSGEPKSLGIGGLSGGNSGSIEASFSESDVDGGDCTGGLVGWNQGRILDAFATGRVQGASRVGGLVGITTSGSTIDRAYALGPTSGSGLVGSLVGQSMLKDGGNAIRNSLWAFAPGISGVGDSSLAPVGTDTLTGDRAHDSTVLRRFGYFTQSNWQTPVGGNPPTLDGLPGLRSFPVASAGVRERLRSPSMDVAYSNVGGRLRLGLARSATVRVVDLQGRQVLPEIALEAGFHDLPLAPSAAVLFLQVRCDRSTTTFGVDPVR